MADALDALRKDRTTPVRTRVEGLFVELRAIDEGTAERSALELFDEVGAWVGDDADEIAAELTTGRHERPRRPPVAL